MVLRYPSSAATRPARNAYSSPSDSGMYENLVSFIFSFLCYNLLIPIQGALDQGCFSFGRHEHSSIRILMYLRKPLACVTVRSFSAISSFTAFSRLFIFRLLHFFKRMYDSPSYVAAIRPFVVYNTPCHSRL